MSEYLHIVCFDAPSPPGYGGAIDLYYKIEALGKLGKKIILHYFSYRDNRNAAGLEKYCSAIHVYERRTGLRSLSFRLPYIVASRIDKNLIANLNADNHPILLEGIHCTGVLPYLNTSRRKVLVRLHNDEEIYYRQLAHSEGKLSKKIYYLIESELLKKYQQHLFQTYSYVSLSEKDISTLKKKYGVKHIAFVPCFIPWQTMNVKQGKGEYCLYHGNLAVSENIKAARWLIEQVFHHTKIPLIIAGKKIPRYIDDLVKRYPHIRTVSDPTDAEMATLIRNAQINVLPSINSTGVKLKVLHALFKGRFCVTNNNGINGVSSSNNVYIADSPAEFIEKVTELFEKEFTQKEIAQRAALCAIYDNEKNAARINELL
jgi:hypothetical protein